MTNDHVLQGGSVGAEYNCNRGVCNFFSLLTVVGIGGSSAFTVKAFSAKINLKTPKKIQFHIDASTARLCKS